MKCISPQFRFELSIYFMWLLVLSCVQLGYTQDIGQQVKTISERTKKDPLRINGGLNFSGNSVFTDIAVRRAAPYSGRANAALYFDFLGIRAPFTMALSSGGRAFNYTLPAYSFVGISPSYGDYKLLLGDRSTKLGRYTFNNQSFRGVGAEITPNNFKFQGFYGRIRRATPQAVNTFQRIDPQYKRMGWGFNTGYEKGGDKLLVGFLNAEDVVNSLGLLDSTLNYNPASNSVFSINGGKEISKMLTISVDWARSATTENTLDPISFNRAFKDDYFGIQKINNSSRWGNALNAQIKLRVKSSELDVNYEKVGPAFKTMGALYFRNDFENISSGLKFTALQKKLITNLRLGVERNNLSRTNANEYSRFIFNLNSNYRVNEKLDVGLSASTFNNTIVQTVPLTINTPINVSQLLSTNSNYGFNSNYLISQSKEILSTVSLHLSRSTGNTVFNDDVQEDKVVSNNAFLIYSRQWIDAKFTASTQISYNSNSILDSKINTSSLSFNFSKLTNKDKTSVSLLVGGGLNTDANNSEKRNLFYTQNTLSVNYKINKKVNFTFYSSVYKNFGKSRPGIQLFYENRNLLTLGYKF